MNTFTIQMLEQILNKHSIEFKSTFHGNDRRAPMHGWSLMAKRKRDGVFVNLRDDITIKDLIDFVHYNRRVFP